MEDKRMDQLTDPTEKNSKEISYLINKTLSDYGHVYLATDWHLFVRDEKGKPDCHMCKNYDKIIQNVTSTMTDKDLLIYLGDLADGEMKHESDMDKLKNVLNVIPGKKVLVLGNNDVHPISYYKSCGFNYVVQSFVWSNVLFTHIPTQNNNQINIHGHIHSNQYPPTYWIPYTNQIDVAYLGGREKLVQLCQVIASLSNYAKHIKEDPSHFGEGYTCSALDNVSLFEQCVGSYNILPDPFPAE
jgi:calcineurin-like phosphoesterase family protein